MAVRQHAIKELALPRKRSGDVKPKIAGATVSEQACQSLGSVATQQNGAMLIKSGWKTTFLCSGARRGLTSSVGHIHGGIAGIRVVPDVPSRLCTVVAWHLRLLTRIHPMRISMFRALASARARAQRNNEVGTALETR